MERPTLNTEFELLAANDMVVGIDEVGRGCVAGPVVCAAVALATPVPIPEGLADSKLLSQRRREALLEPVRQWATAWGVGWASADLIDSFGIVAGLHLASRAALNAIPLTAHSRTIIILDGNRDFLSKSPPRLVPATGPLPEQIQVITVIKGDQKCASVAGASILAKVARDEFMAAQAATYPDYGFAQHVGYLTAAHRDALAKYGPTDLHRKSFAGVL